MQSVHVAYVAPKDAVFQRLSGLLTDRRAIQKLQEILSPLRLPEELTIKTVECGEVNSWYTRENLKPTVTSTTLADLVMPLLAADPFSAVWASVRWWPSDEFEDGLAHCW